MDGLAYTSQVGVMIKGGHRRMDPSGNLVAVQCKHTSQTQLAERGWMTYAEGVNIMILLTGFLSRMPSCYPQAVKN